MVEVLQQSQKPLEEEKSFYDGGELMKAQDDFFYKIT